MAERITSITVQGYPIAIDVHGNVSLTDMAKAVSKEARPADTIRNWLNTKTTLDFLAMWENRYNTKLFKVLEFQHFRENHNKPDTISVQAWNDDFGAIGIFSKMGAKGGTYAHQDIATEFGTYISGSFKFLLLEEFKRLREKEYNEDNVNWNIRRLLSKSQYKIQTDAVKDYKIPMLRIPENLAWQAYSVEGDILNLALFGFTAKQWREANVKLAEKNLNARDFASENELIVLSNIEAINAEYIKDGMPYPERLRRLKQAVISQKATLDKHNPERSIRKG